MVEATAESVAELSNENVHPTRASWCVPWLAEVFSCRNTLPSVLLCRDPPFVLLPSLPESLPGSVFGLWSLMLPSPVSLHHLIPVVNRRGVEGEEGWDGGDGRSWRVGLTAGVEEANGGPKEEGGSPLCGGHAGGEAVGVSHCEFRLSYALLQDLAGPIRRETYDDAKGFRGNDARCRGSRMPLCRHTGASEPLRGRGTLARGGKANRWLSSIDAIGSRKVSAGF